MIRRPPRSTLFPYTTPLPISHREGQIDAARSERDLLPAAEIEMPVPDVHVAVADARDRKSTRLNSSHSQISYAVFCLKKKPSSTPAPALWPWRPSPRTLPPSG